MVMGIKQMEDMLAYKLIITIDNHQNLPLPAVFFGRVIDIGHVPHSSTVLDQCNIIALIILGHLIGNGLRSPISGGVINNHSAEV